MVKCKFRKETKQKLSYKILKNKPSRGTIKFFHWEWSHARIASTYFHTLKRHFIQKGNHMKKLLAWSYTIVPSFHREGLKLLPHFFKFDTDVIKRFLAHLFEYHALKLKKKNTSCVQWGQSYLEYSNLNCPCVVSIFKQNCIKPDSDVNLLCEPHI